MMKRTSTPGWTTSFDSENKTCILSNEPVAKRARFNLSSEFTQPVPRLTPSVLNFVIDNYVELVKSLEIGAEVNSCIFEIPLYEAGVAKLSIIIFPNGQENAPRKFGCFIKNEGDFDVHVNVVFRIKSRKGNWWEDRKGCFERIRNTEMKGSSFPKSSLFFSGEEGLPNGRLILEAVLLFAPHLAKGCPNEKVPPSLGPSLAMMLNGKFSDIEIVCNEQRFKCHKVVLAARSPVFKAMFEHDNAESAEGKIVINDFDSKIMENFIQFMYTDKIDDAVLEECVHDLFVMADKYDVPKLKQICEQHICNTVDVDNAAKVYILGYLHEVKALKSAAFKMISRAREEVKATEDWQRIKEHSGILNELLEAFMKHEKNNSSPKFITFQKS